MNHSNVNCVFRHEYKYTCNAMQNALLKTKKNMLMQRDSHSGEDGAYRIRSLYFDDYEGTCFYENESGVGDRDKYRIRIYNADISRITLEKKSKIRGMTHKTACRISEEMCRQFMNGVIPQIREEMTTDLKILLLEMQQKNLRPVVIVEYLRFPYVEKAGNVRITFDENLASSGDIKCFLDIEIAVRPIMEKGMGILEVKWDAFLPTYIKSYLQMDRLQWTSFSKYYICRKYNAYGGMKA